MPRYLRALVPAAVVLVLLLNAGCSRNLARQKGLTDAGLFEEGQQKAQKKKHDDAAEAFQLLLERYPNSPLAPGAQFGLAEARKNLGEELEAEAAFDDFLRLYPADPKVPDALFLKGDLLYRQVQKAGRAQDKTRETIETYKRFLGKETGTKRSEEAGARIREMRQHLVRNEEIVISHFLSRKQYDSAEIRARRVLEEYPDAAPTPKLLALFAEALDRQGKKEEASQIRKTLEEKFPKHGSGNR